MESAQQVLKIARPCDIIEFAHPNYNHYAFYIGDGVCVSMIQSSGKEGSCCFSSNSSSSKLSSSAISCPRPINGTKIAQKLVDIANGRKCRVNNLAWHAEKSKEQKRPYYEARELAVEGLPLDYDGEIILGRRVPVGYPRMTNCKAYARYLRYANVDKQPSAYEVLRIAKPCDVIEFDRGTFKHYAFYIGDGVCVHVEAIRGNCCFSPFTPTSSTSSSRVTCLSASSSSYLTSSRSSTSQASAAISRCIYGTKIAQKLLAIAKESKCRVYNFASNANLGKDRIRSQSEAIDLAIEGLPMDEDGEVILERRVPVEYPPGMGWDNCKGYTRYLKYVNMESAEEVLKIAKPCDIIEFDRDAYKHYAFYIGKGVCVHIQGPPEPEARGGSSGPSSNSSNLSSNLSSQFSAALGSSNNGTKSAELLVRIANGSKCRINNFEREAKLKLKRKRPENEARRLALKDIPFDDDGYIILGQSVPAKYQLLRHNCEDYVTQWKYECKGFSCQAEEAVQEGITIGTVVLGAAFLIGKILLK